MEFNDLPTVAEIQTHINHRRKNKDRRMDNTITDEMLQPKETPVEHLHATPLLDEAMVSAAFKESIIAQPYKKQRAHYEHATTVYENIAQLANKKEPELKKLFS